jgi:hypothetical protein
MEPGGSPYWRRRFLISKKYAARFERTLLPQHSSFEFDEAQLGSGRHDALVMSFERCVTFPKSRNNNKLRGEEDSPARAEHQNCSAKATVIKIRSGSRERERPGYLNVISKPTATITFFIFLKQQTDLEFIWHPRLDLIGRVSTFGSASRGAEDVVDQRHSVQRS